MKQPTPKIDPRTAPDIFNQVVEMLDQQEVELIPAGDWKAFQPKLGSSGALIRIFARFAELITDRLNRVPDKNFLAFLDLLGASLLPPTPARAPLTFSLTDGATRDAIVPAGTEVAAVAAEGEKAPAVFETESDLVVTASRLKAAFTRDPAKDLYTNHVLLLPQSNEDRSPEAVFQAVSPTEHLLYVAHDGIFNHPGKTSVTIKLTLFDPKTFRLQPWQKPKTRINLAWEIWDEATGHWPTQNKGEVIDETPIDLTTLNPQPTIVNGIRKRWLRGRLLDPITPEKIPPYVTVLTFSGTFERTDRVVETAFTNSVPIDMNRGFYPFGESPVLGNALYLKMDRDFAESDCDVTIGFTLSVVSPKPAEDKSPAPKVSWEFWNGASWATLNATDNTANLTIPNPVRFRFPDNAVLTNVNGVEGYWIRARLESGSYGPAAQLKVEKNGDNYTYTSIPASAPLVSSMKISYKTTLTDRQPENVLAYNDFTFEDRALLPDKASFIPFHALLNGKPTFYLGFQPPPNLSRMPNDQINVYISATGEMDATARPQIEWHYSTGPGETGWASITVLDDTENFTRSGIVEFLAPPDFAPRSEAGETLYWLRAVLIGGTYTSEPQISLLLLNTVMARHATRIKNEILGSSDASKNQKFRTSLAPVLEGQRLEVRELEMPSQMEQDEIKQDAGEDAVTIVADEAGRQLEVWVLWKQVPDFYGSARRDRHYVLDYVTGEVRFGDGISGMIPPRASGNIRMSSYETGGGVRGNKPAGAIKELRTSLPYVERATNYVASSGGAEAEIYESLVERMPRMIRHGGCAVTYQDYEDLAMLASTEVARARCVRFYDKEGVGKVTLVVVPRSTGPVPVPSRELIRRVQEFIDNRKSPLVQLTVEPPSYVPVNVTVDIAPGSIEIASALKLDVLERINRFLHPLTGGFNGEGWDFGRQPHESDLYYLIEAIAGVDHIRSLTMPPVTIDSEQCLIASGTLVVSCKF